MARLGYHHWWRHWVSTRPSSGRFPQAVPPPPLAVVTPLLASPVYLITSEQINYKPVEESLRSDLQKPVTSNSSDSTQSTCNRNSVEQNPCERLPSTIKELGSKITADSRDTLLVEKEKKLGRGPIGRIWVLDSYHMTNYRDTASLTPEKTCDGFSIKSSDSNRILLVPSKSSLKANTHAQSFEA
jgi:hypothetical protein